MIRWQYQNITEPMRVIILTPGLPLNLENSRGGVHSAVNNLVKGFAGYDIDVRLFHFPGK
jgi:hypothetical protein